LLDSTGLTELTEDVIKTIVTADQKEKLIFGLRVVIYVGNITARRNTIYITSLITSRRNIYPEKNSKYILSSGNILRIDRLLISIYFLLNLKVLKVY
jgi:hypothetical protein